MNQVWVYPIIFVLLFLLELAYFYVARKLHIIDHPNKRSSHSQPVVRGGGIIFPVSVWLWAALFGWRKPWFLLGMTLISGISYIDDIKDESKATRLLIQFTAMVMMFHEHNIMEARLWWVIIADLIFCVGVINAFNFMDGINGILGGYSVVVLGALYYLDTYGLLTTGLDTPFVASNLIVVCLLAALVFCFFNFRKRALCFAGDVGSVGMAYIVVFILGWLILKTGDFSYIMLLAVFGVDAVMTILHRIMLHEDITESHRKHAYQIMANELKIPQVAVSGFYAALQALVTIGLIFLPVNHYVYSAVVLVVLCLAYILFMRKYYHLHEEYLKGLQP